MFLRPHSLANVSKHVGHVTCWAKCTFFMWLLTPFCLWPIFFANRTFHHRLTVTDCLKIKMFVCIHSKCKQIRFCHCHFHKIELYARLSCVHRHLWPMHCNMNIFNKFRQSLSIFEYFLLETSCNQKFVSIRMISPFLYVICNIHTELNIEGTAQFAVFVW